MIDGCDAFVREATAAMDAVRHNKYSGRILPGGLHGALLQGGQPINSATDSIETRIKQFERQTSELKGSVGSIVSALDNGAAEMSGTAGNLRVGASTTRERVTSIATASEQAASTCSRVVSATAKLSSNASDVGADIQRSSEIAGRAVERVADAAGNVNVLKDGRGAHQRGRQVDQRHRQPDQPSGAERDDRGGACGRCRARLRCRSP